MANRPNQKLRLLYVLKTFLDMTDESHGITTQQIVEELAYYDLEAERKAIYRDIQALKAFGLDIAQRVGKEWYLASRPLGLQELIMLVDAVQSTPFLTEEMTDHLIGQLQKFASIDQRALLQRRIEVPGRVKMQNSDALQNLDIIQQAMRLKRKIEFRYYHYDAKKRKVLNRDGRSYVATPVRLVYADEFYYLIAFMDQWANAGGEHQPFTPYRVDRVIDLAVLDEPATKDPRIASYITEEHVSPSFGVFAAEKVPVVLELEEAGMNPVIDKFGIDALVFDDKDGTLQAHVKAPLSPQFFGWLLQVSPFVRIVSPKRAVEQFREVLGGAQKLYSGEE